MKDKLTIALHCIVKDEQDKVERIINLYKDFFDSLDFAIDDTDVFSNLTKKYSDAKIKFFNYTKRMSSGRINFAEKRNFLADRHKTDYYFRLDTDDLIRNPEKVKETLDKNSECSVITCYYEYSKDEWGNIDNGHYRETFIKNEQNLKWVSTSGVHETIIPVSLQGFIMESTEDIRLIHDIEPGHGIKSVTRNLEYLKEEYELNKENTDPRTLAYLGRTYADLKDFPKSIYFLERHIRRSGWDEDRYLSWVLLSKIFYILGRNEESKSCCFEALQECPDRPEAFFRLHDIYYNIGDYNKSIEWALQGMAKPLPKGNIPTSPNDYTLKPLLTLAESYAQTERYEEAYKTICCAEKYAPTLDYIKQSKVFYGEAIDRQKFVDNFSWLVNFLKDKEPDRCKDLVKAIPKYMEDHVYITKLKQLFTPEKVWGDNEVCIFCGSTAEPWSPKSKDKGIGGSEEAVICMSESLTKLGYKVTVYNECGDDEGEYNGVQYLSWAKFNSHDRFNIMISWRMNIFFYEISAKRKIVWVHDLPVNLNFTEETINRVDKIIVLSEYHKSLLPEVAKGKAYVSTNGLVPEDFEGIQEDRNPYRLIYASSYNRGLETILENWGEIKEKVPQSELHCFYGWDVYDLYVKNKIIKDDGWKQKMVNLMNQPGVFEHGRVGHKELLREYAKSGVFAYPCHYAGEINCIALTKAIACGCVAVTNDFAVLKERNPMHVTADNKFVYTLTRVLKGKYNTPDIDIDKYIKDNSWDSVADDWAKNIFPLDIDIEIKNRIDWINDYFNQYKGNGTKIVDIGSAKGFFFQDWDRKNITSVDIDEYDYENFVRANAEKLPFKDKQFDKALVAELIEHCDNPIKVLSEAKRVSKEVVVTVPYEYEWSEDYKPFNTLEKELEDTGLTPDELSKEGNPDAKGFHNDGAKHLYHQRWYTPELLDSHLREAGYEDYKITKLRWKDLSWLTVVGK